jgi:hypothetical protein
MQNHSGGRRAGQVGEERKGVISKVHHRCIDETLFGSICSERRSLQEDQRRASSVSHESSCDSDDVRREDPRPTKSFPTCTSVSDDDPARNEA